MNEEATPCEAAKIVKGMNGASGAYFTQVWNKQIFFAQNCEKMKIFLPPKIRGWEGVFFKKPFFVKKWRFLNFLFVWRGSMEDINHICLKPPFILSIRGKQVILDRDLARLYGVETRVLNQAVQRNIERFPEDFMFQLTKEEFENWKSQFAISNYDEDMSSQFALRLYRRRHRYAK